MIKIIGEKKTNEYQAAERIADFFEEMWEGIKKSPIEEDHVVIRAGACISGQKRNEIDLFIVAKLKRGRRFKPNKVIKTHEGVRVGDEWIAVENIILAGEEKGHSGDRLKITGNEIFVKYKDQDWKSATRQNVEQIHSLKSYLGDRGLNPFICGFIYLSNVHEKLGNSINPSLTAQDFFSRVIQGSSVKQNSNRFEYRSTSNQNIEEYFKLPILREFRPSNLDRKKMELLSSESRLANSLVNDDPKSLTQISGVGGTGKTVILLQAASKFYLTRGERSLFLTFNLSLAAEVQRLMAFQNIKSSEDNGGIKVQTVMSFFYMLFERLGFGLSSVENDSFSNFEEYQPLLELVNEAVNNGEVNFNEVVSMYLDELEFDHVFVDEAQDWHPQEANILKKLFYSTPIYVADGRQQMVRTFTPARWFEGVDKKDRRFEQLKKCVRQKSSLAGFLKSMSVKFDSEWDGEIFTRASGGNLILNCGNFESTGVFEDLATNCKMQGIENIDWLVMIPPSAVIQGAPKSTTISSFFNSKGFKALDLVEEKNRKEIYSDTEAFRVIQYESCRGLEGWVAVLYRFDDFLEMKLNSQFNINTAIPYSFEDLDIKSKQFVWNWFSMVFSRAMDTVVLNVNNPSYGIGRVIVDHCKQSLDTVEFKPQIR